MVANAVNVVLHVSGLLGVLAQYVVRIPLHADVWTELKLL